MRRDSNDFDIISEIPAEPGFSGATTSANSGATKLDSLSHQTVPPKPSNENVTLSHNSNPELSCLACCCLYGRDETFTTPIQVSEKNQYCFAVAQTLRKFLSTVAIYCYVLLLTFFLSILLLAELLLALKIIVVQEAQRLVNESSLASSFSSQSRQTYVLNAVHWTNFSLLSLCLFEVVLRVFAWKLDLVKSAAAVCDTAAVTVAFVVNVVTTSAAGFDSPFNAISLIIVFRFVRIVSLVEVSTRRVKVLYQEKLAQSESNTAVLQVANQKLNRQLSEKDYEIKQLRGHLGKLDDETRQDLTGEWRQRKENETRYDDELEKAIAISKQEYEEVHGGGFSNPSYVDHTQRLEGFCVPDVTVHHREDSVRRNQSDVPSTSKLHPTSGGDTGISSSKDNRDRNISHGDLHAGTDLDGHHTPADTTLLLESSEKKPHNDHWTVGYCLVQPQHPDLSSKKRDFQVKNEKKSDLEQEDEGIGEESFSPVKKNKRRRSISADPVSADDTLSDQGCVSVTSLCSESGYQSEERLTFNPPPVSAITPPREHATSSLSPSVNPSSTGPEGIAMSDLGDNASPEVVKEKSEDEL